MLTELEQLEAELTEARERALAETEATLDKALAEYKYKARAWAAYKYKAWTTVHNLEAQIVKLKEQDNG